MSAKLTGEWLSPMQAANRLNISTQRVRQLLDAGQLAYVVTPLGRLVDAADVVRLAAERAERAEARGDKEATA
ncbi:MAG TPA: hypothetical protein VII06_19100 [Chloroflexota bacterium]|jgi:excisionase family DNA binding protein